MPRRRPSTSSQARLTDRWPVLSTQAFQVDGMVVDQCIGVTSDKVFPTWIRLRIDLNNPRRGANHRLLHISIAFGQWLW